MELRESTIQYADRIVDRAQELIRSGMTIRDAFRQAIHEESERHIRAIVDRWLNSEDV